MTSSTSSALFVFAKRRDTWLRRREVQGQFKAMAMLWTERAGIDADQCAVGTNPRAPLSSVLLGVRLGTCQLEIPCVVAGVDATATVIHDIARGRDLRLVVRPRVPRQYARWSIKPATLSQVRHLTSSDDSARLLDGVHIGHLRTDDDLDPYIIGSTTLIELGDSDVTSNWWTANLLGAFRPTDRWSGSLAGVDLKIDTYDTEPRDEGQAGSRLTRRFGALRRLVREAGWRRDYVAGDHAQLLRLEFQFTQPVTVLTAEAYLLDHVCRTLHLFSGARPTLCGLWDPNDEIGRLLDLGRPLVANRHPLISRNEVTLRDFMDEVAPKWSALPEGRRKAVNIAMDALTAMPPDVEPAVMAGAMTLEFLADALLPKANNSYNLDKAQRKEILAGITALAGTIAPNSVWENDLDRVASRLFQPPAGDRILALLDAYSISTSPAERAAYTAVRNSIAHGRRGDVTFDQKMTTTGFSRYVGWSVLMRVVGFTGVLADHRTQQRVQARPASRVT